jgi:acylphosphatase
MTEMASLQAFVRGHVHGVFFRGTVETWAAELNLTGYVRNRVGDVVEVAVEGEKPQLEKLVGYLKVGPPAARVDEVKCYWMDYKGKFTSFSIRE